MESAIATTIRAYVRGELDLVATKAALLRHYPGFRKPHEALLLADYVEEVAICARDGTLAIDDAVGDLVAVREGAA